MNGIENLAITFGIATVGSLIATGLALSYAKSRNILDVSNERSSHVGVVPRGGGIGIVVVFLIGLGVLAFTQRIEQGVAVGLGGGGFMIALVGWLDDRYSLSASKRALVHLAAAIWLLSWAGTPHLQFGSWAVVPNLVSQAILAIALVWATNLYNFMDGIDGLSGGEGVLVGAFGAVLMLAMGASGVAMIGALLAGACLGFLWWNWPPAKVFMGDVGSGFLGFLVGGLAIVSAGVQPIGLWIWATLLGVFLADTGVTLARRVIRGEKWYLPHRSHAFQRLSRRFGRHLPATLSVLAPTVLWLAPAAWLALNLPMYGAVIFLVSLLPLVITAALLGAGLPDDR